MNFSSLNLLDVVHGSDSSLSVGLLAVTVKELGRKLLVFVKSVPFTPDSCNYFNKYYEHVEVWG
jgi:hypothetical protein